MKNKKKKNRRLIHIPNKGIDTLLMIMGMESLRISLFIYFLEQSFFKEDKPLPLFKEKF